MKIQMKNLTKATAMFPLAVLLMGNESCEKSAVKVRSLKKIVEMGQIASPALRLPDGSRFDFQFVANQQAYGVLMESEGFALRYNPPLSTGSNGATELKLTSGDNQIFAKALSNGVNPYTNWSTEASCMVNLPMARVYGSVNSFEMVGGGGLTIGFTPAGAQTGAGSSLGFNVKKAQLDLSLIATRPLTNSTIQAVNVTAKQTSTNVNALINLGMFALGPSFYYQTPLASVTKNALTKAVTSLKTKMETETWYTRVLANHDTHMTVIGGQNVGLSAGDELAIYNETYYWDGEPCASTYRGGAAKDPVAIILVEAVGDEISIGRVIQQTDENVVIGAKVKLQKLYVAPVVDPKKAATKKAVSKKS